MKLIILILAVNICSASQNNEKKCSDVIVNNINHVKEVLKSGLNRPNQLAIDYDTQTIFFSCFSNDGIGVHKSAYINLKNNESNIIPGINGGFANAVDSKEHVVYLGGQDGIYTFNFETKQAEHKDGTNHYILQMFFREELYYTKYPEESAYFYKYNDFQRVPELQSTRTMMIALDVRSNIYYSNSSGLYVYRRAKEYSVRLGDYDVNGFTTDLSGDLYFSTAGGIFSIDSKTREVKRIAIINDVYGLAIEVDGNIIYASNDSIIRLRPTKTYCR